jgi:L-fuculose-phosphate aldolase
MTLGTDERTERQAIIDTCQRMNADGLNQGTSGNVSQRLGDGFLITPTSRPYASLMRDDIVYMGMDGSAHGPWKPSSEWRFHRDILQARSEVNAIVHAHPTYCTTLAIYSKDIPSIHYMVAIFGGSNIRCAPYAIYGSQELSDYALEALKDRKACLLAHHGMIAAGDSLDQAYWLVEELENLAQQFHGCLQLGEPPLLSDTQIQDVMDKIAEYGMGEG